MSMTGPCRAATLREPVLAKGKRSPVNENRKQARNQLISGQATQGAPVDTGVAEE